MAVRTYLEAISDGLREEMRRDDRVLVIGEDVGVYGGAFKVTKGFQEEFGEWRVIDAPLAETAIVGACTGAAMMGLRPVAEMQFADFISCCWDHLVTIAAKQHWRTGASVPIVVRCPSGGGFSGGPFHSQNPESSFAHIPGLKIVCPSTPADAKGLLIQSIRDENPVLYFEHKHLYRRIKDEVPEGDITVPFGVARVARAGRRPHGRHLGRDGAHRHAPPPSRPRPSTDISVEVIDLRTIMPWDREAVLAVRRAHRQGARPARGHAHRRFRRRDRRDHRRGGLREPRRPRRAPAGARHAGAVLAAARAALHSTGRRRPGRRPQALRLLIAGRNP